MLEKIAQIVEVSNRSHGMKYSDFVMVLEGMSKIMDKQVRG